MYEKKIQKNAKNAIRTGERGEYEVKIGEEWNKTNREEESEALNEAILNSDKEE